MKNITDRFVLDSDGITTLKRLDNIINKKRILLKDNSFNMLLVYEDIKEAKLFVEELGDYIEKKIMERNNSSHAADSELRLPFSVIEAMISQYISISDELLNH